MDLLDYFIIALIMIAACSTMESQNNDIKKELEIIKKQCINNSDVASKP